MPPKVRNAWENLKASLWFVPTIFVVSAFILAQLPALVGHQHRTTCLGGYSLVHR